QTYTFGVGCPIMNFINTTASNAVIGSAYSLNVSVTGNTQPVTYSISPALPAGLTLNTSTGQITGTPTALSPATTYTVTATQSGSCSVTQTYTFAVEQPNSLVNVSTSFKIYPNPTAETIFVEGNTGGYMYELQDMQGKILGKGRADSSLIRINVSGLSSGMYLLNLKTGGEEKRVKFVKQ
ncbi:MAG: T9SS type A sorting domain-containing protein, partial [Raineya sp.]|nr:T9SS type A sorting domain-containing protein [Raineya sp.]